MSSKKGVDFLKQIAKFVAKTNGFDACMKNIEITNGGDGNCTAEFTVSDEHVNRNGTLHGGFTATLVDNITTYALMSKNSHPGVTVDLHVSYLKSAKIGDEVIIDANTVKAGKTLAYIECELRHKKDGSVIAKGGQTKFVYLS